MNIHMTGTISYNSNRKPRLLSFRDVTKIRNSLISTKVMRIEPITYDNAFEIPGTLALLDLAKLAEKQGWSGPVDLSTNHDKYFE